jgi:hypothetical protein
MTNHASDNAGRKTVAVARTILVLGILALLGAWLSELRDSRSLFGLTQQHLFNDAMALTLISIAVFADAYFHLRLPRQR